MLRKAASRFVVGGTGSDHARDTPFPPPANAIALTSLPDYPDWRERRGVPRPATSANGKFCCDDDREIEWQVGDADGGPRMRADIRTKALCLHKGETWQPV
ncbi:hypothetical protein [Bradyrhizobium sp. UFLA03-84]|uniref:hypothetical protein n=1 Tax=Bradyrhizobium sp. UFLA03-84 TaxID=418599 RepID=UPI0013041722|nr:hypothetical protein [Bradyrhizobium sp. UFLA03-84]